MASSCIAFDVHESKSEDNAAIDDLLAAEDVNSALLKESEHERAPQFIPA